MPKKAISFTDEMQAALDDEAKRRAAPVSAVVREAIKEFLEKRGNKVDSDVNWGGNRRDRGED
jgi:predicted transcriptional regulator